MTLAILRRAHPRQELIRFVIVALGAGFAGTAYAQGSAGAVPAVYGSVWAASQQMALAARTRTVKSSQASAPVRPVRDIRVSERTTGSE